MSTNEDGQAPIAVSRRRRLLRPILLVGIPLVVLLVAGLMMIFSGRYVSTENAYIDTSLTNIAPEVSGRVTQVLVEDNEPVDEGQTLLRINPEPYRIAVARAEARLTQAINSIRTLKARYATRQEELSLARENVTFAKSELARQQSLAKRNLTSQSELASYQHEYTTAQRHRSAVERDLNRIAVSLGGDVDQPLEEHPDYQAAQANLESARLDLENTKIRASFDGIAAKTPDTGTYARAGSPIMSLVGRQRFWIDANFKETDLTRVQPGQSVSVEVDTYPDQELHGVVESIAQATGSKFSVLPAQNATGNWVKVVQRIPVRIRLDDSARAVDLRSGMSTAVEIDTGYPESGLPVVGWLRGLPSEAHASQTPAE